MQSELRRLLIIPLVWLLVLLSACSNFEEKRVRELMHEKGFGTRAQGDATTENYVAGGDFVGFDISPASYQDPSAQQLYQLTQPQRVGLDGTISVPYVGPVHVLGKTEAQLTTMVKGLLQPYFQFQLDLQARIAGDMKHIYAFGEVANRGPVPIQYVGGSDLTLFHVVAKLNWTQLANLGRVYLIRPDAENPLVVEVNLSEMITTGRMAMNIRVRENDIIYIPPTFLGLVARILERILAPLNLAVRSLLGLAQIQQSYDLLTGKSSYPVYFTF